MENLFFYFSDIVWFSVLQIIICAIAFISVFKSAPTGISLVRGKESINYLTGITSAIFLGFLTVVFSITSFPVEGKVFLFFANSFLALYLGLWNFWSTNKIVSLYSKYKQRNVCVNNDNEDRGN